MANGFFLGGAAEGMQAQEQLGLKRSELAQELALKTRGLDLQEKGLGLREKEMGQDFSLRTRALNLQEKAQNFANARTITEEADKRVSGIMTVVAETITQSLAAGKDPAILAKTIRPLVESAKSIAAKSGRDPTMLDNTVNTLFARPTGTEVAAAAGKAEGVKKVESAKAIAAATGEGVDIDPYKDPKDKVQLENSLRDDYLKASGEFVKIRDAKNRLDKIQETGAGDIALLFQFMKILDPGSTVREGEFATAGSVAGVPGQIEAVRKQLVGGGRLADDARKQIISQANQLYQAASSQQDRMTTRFADVAKRQKLNPNNVVIELSPNADFEPKPGVTPGGIKYKVISQ